MPCASTPRRRHDEQDIDIAVPREAIPDSLAQLEAARARGTRQQPRWRPLLFESEYTVDTAQQRLRQQAVGTQYSDLQLATVTPYTRLLRVATHHRPE